MRVSVEDNAPGEITRKLPDIVRHLLQLDAEAAAHASAHDHDAPLLKAMGPAQAGEPDPNESRFTNPTALAMYRRAKALADARAQQLVTDVRAALGGGA